MKTNLGRPSHQRLCDGAFPGAVGHDRRARGEGRAYSLEEEVNVEAAQRIWRSAFQKSLSDKDNKCIASALHHGFAFVSGAAYAALGESWPKIRAGYGTAYGTAVFILGDEIAVTAAGLSNPLKKPIESHASAFVAHLIFGAVLEGVLRYADQRR